MNKFKVIMIGAVLVLLNSCVSVSHVQPCLSPTEHVYGFWGGTWHGLIMFFSFIGSLFNDDIAVYAVNNNGHWYDFGFVGGFFLMIRLVSHFLSVVLK